MTIFIVVALGVLAYFVTVWILDLRLQPQGTFVDSPKSEPKKKNLQPLAKLIYMRVLKAQKHQIEVSVLSKETGYSEKEIREAAFESLQLEHVISWDMGEHAEYVTIKS